MRAVLFTEHTGETVLHLVTLDHEDWDAPIRLTDDDQAVESRGETYVPWPLRVTLPSEEEDVAPRARLEVDVITREVTLGLRGIVEAPTVLIEVVLASDPDAVEIAWPEMIPLPAQWSPDGRLVTVELTLEDEALRAFPSNTFNPVDYAGLF